MIARGVSKEQRTLTIVADLEGPVLEFLCDSFKVNGICREEASQFDALKAEILEETEENEQLHEMI